METDFNTACSSTESLRLCPLPDKHQLARGRVLIGERQVPAVFSVYEVSSAPDKSKFFSLAGRIQQHCARIPTAARFHQRKKKESNNKFSEYSATG
ncbi:MAG: hypothetical protein ACLSB9_16175 [Hydrogeniiclostridium mannosilyticum]